MIPEKTRKIILAVAIAGLSVFIVHMLLQQKKAKQPPSQQRPAQQAPLAGNQYEILVANVDVSPGSKVQENMVAVRDIPERYIQPGAIFSLEEVQDKITIAPILRGEQILSTKFGASYERGGTLAVKTPPGKRAITVDIDPISAVGGMVRRGDNIDILSTFVLDAKEGGPVTVTLLQNVLVLDIRYGQDDKGNAVPGTITFALAPQEAELFLFAKQQGRVHLTLRTPLDAEVLEVPPVNWYALFRAIAPQDVAQQVDQALPEEAKQPPKPEIFKGLNKQ